MSNKVTNLQQPSPTTHHLENLAVQAIKNSLQRNGFGPEPSGSPKPGVVSKVLEGVKSVLSEALVLIPRTFILKTEWVSSKTKEAHERLYKGYIEQFNKLSVKLDAVNKEDTTTFRELKADETYNFNAVKLHELYFGNISDQTSEIHRDSLPYMRLSRDWGTFEAWQFDFIATAMAAREGWAMVYYDPFKDKYMHAMIDTHSVNVPVCGIPVLVLDMWSHAYFKDYLDDKRSYVTSFMREFNWAIVEARMVIAERANLKDLYLVRPLVNNQPEKMIDQAANAPPIGKGQITPSGVEIIPAPGSEMQVNPKPIGYP